ncbi:MAG: hypothetical protein AVDCRST_MAG85-911, partial [uncultured Solirubrobacteraceae bacterium]
GARHVHRRGPDAGRRGLQRRGHAGLDPDRRRLDRHPGAASAAAGPARADRAAALQVRVRHRALRPGRGLRPGLRGPRPAPGGGGRVARRPGHVGPAGEAQARRGRDVVRGGGLRGAPPRGARQEALGSLPSGRRRRRARPEV